MLRKPISEEAFSLNQGTKPNFLLKGVKKNQVQSEHSPAFSA